VDDTTGARQTADEWRVTATHEYFHALSWGSLTSPALVNSLFALLNAEANWLFEGAATALSGRVIHGDGARPALDPKTISHPTMGQSLWATGDVPADPVQGFFYFLERSLGHADFYRPMFEAIGLERDNTEKAVRAADDALAAVAMGRSLGRAFGDFAQDLMVDNPQLYHAPPQPHPVPLLGDGRERVLDATVPPLSYTAYRFTLPALPAQAGPDEPRDFEIAVRVGQGDAAELRVVLDARKDDGRLPDFPAVLRFTAGEGARVIADVRAARSSVTVLLVNQRLKRDEQTTVRITARLKRPQPLMERLAFESGRRGDPSNAIEVMDPAAGAREIVSQSTAYLHHLRGLGAAGHLLEYGEALAGGDDRVVLLEGYGKGAVTDVNAECDLVSGFGLEKDAADLTDAGHVFFGADRTDPQTRRPANGVFRYAPGEPCARLPIDVTGDALPDSVHVDALAVARRLTDTLVFATFVGSESVVFAADARVGGGARRLAADYGKGLVLSADGSRVAFFRDSDDHLVTLPTAASGTPIDLTAAAGARLVPESADISPDGTLVAALSGGLGGGVLLIESDGRRPRQIAVAAPLLVYPAGRVAFSADQRNVVFSCLDASKGSDLPDLCLAPVGGGAPVRNLTATTDRAELNPRSR
jgi:hypothetical protein